MLRKLFIHTSDHVLVQLIRYGVVALIAFGIDFGLLYVFTSHLHIFYVISAALSFSLALIVNYILSSAWVFPGSGMHRATELFLFVVIGVIGLLLNVVFIWLFTSGLEIYYLTSKLIATVLVFGWSFAGRRYLIYRRTS